MAGKQGPSLLIVYLSSSCLLFSADCYLEVGFVASVVLLC